MSFPAKLLVLAHVRVLVTREAHGLLSRCVKCFARMDDVDLGRGCKVVVVISFRVRVIGLGQEVQRTNTLSINNESLFHYQTT